MTYSSSSVVMLPISGGIGPVRRLTVRDLRHGRELGNRLTCSCIPYRDMKTPSHKQDAPKDLQLLKVGELSKSWRDCSINVVASQITVQ